MAGKDSGNVSVTIPKSITNELDKYVKKYRRYISRSNLIKQILNSWLDEQHKVETQYQDLKKIIKKRIRK